jgi:hypothetical protein
MRIPYGYADSLSWIRGKHSLKAGASLTFVQNNAFFAYQSVGGFQFNGPAGIGSHTDLADFLLALRMFIASTQKPLVQYAATKWLVMSKMNGEFSQTLR